MSKGRILYIAPVYKPAIGGGVVYLEMLSKYAIELGYVEKFTILTEKFPNEPAVENDNLGISEIRRFFPYRAGKNSNSIMTYIAYFIQNIMYLFVPFMLYRRSVNVLIVHSSLHNNPNILFVLLWMVRFFMPKIKCIVDIRDPKLPVKRYWQLSKYDCILSCSDNVTKKFKNNMPLCDRIIQIPVPVEKFVPTNDEIKKIKDDYELLNVQYFFLGSGLNIEKGILLAMELTKELRKRGRNIIIVVAGKKRYWDESLEKAKKDGWLRYVGQIPHKHVITLSAGAWIDLNLSIVDSMPRHSLEVLVAGGKILLPANVPEFIRWCPDHIADMKNLNILANQAEIIGNSSRNSCMYPTREHYPKEVFKKYKEILTSI